MVEAAASWFGRDQVAARRGGGIGGKHRTQIGATRPVFPRYRPPRGGPIRDGRVPVTLLACALRSADNGASTRAS